MPTANTTVRLDARISTDLHAMLKRAADLQGRTMADFVVAAVQDAAQRRPRVAATSFIGPASTLSASSPAERPSTVIRVPSGSSPARV